VAGAAAAAAADVAAAAAADVAAGGADELPVTILMLMRILC